MAVISLVPELRIHTPLTSDPQAIERALEEALPTGRFTSRHLSRLYDGATRAADLFDQSPGRRRVVLFVTFNAQNQSDKQTRKLIELYEERGIRLEVVALQSSGTRMGWRGAAGPPVICDPGPGCPPVRGRLEPDKGTLDRVAIATGGRVRRTATRRQDRLARSGRRKFAPDPAAHPPRKPRTPRPSAPL